jgi:putative addiction module killer protein
MNYTCVKFEIIKSAEFTEWASGLRDRQAALRITARIKRAQLGNLGDYKFLRDGVSEMRIDTGAGYRLYFTRRGDTVVILLVGGDKRMQDKDIERAIALAKIWKE